MNNYSRLEINLLPPELLPGPTVRYALLINIGIILFTVAFIGLSVYLHWLKLNVAMEERVGLQAQVATKAGVVKDYDRLNKIGVSIGRYGRLIALASDDYVEMPVVLDRIAKILPDEVFLTRITNNRTEGKGLPIVLGVQLTASDQDPDLMIRTLNAFKQEPMLADCFLPAAEFTEVSLDELMQRYQIDWSVNGPDVEPQVWAKHYLFEIDVRLNRPLDISEVPVQRDVTGAFDNPEMVSAPAAQETQAEGQGEES